MLRCQDKQLWPRIADYVGQAQEQEVSDEVSLIGIDGTSLHRGQSYLTMVHDLQSKRLLFATPGRNHQTVLDFVADLVAHGGNPADVEHVCMDMSAAYAKGVAKALPGAQVSFDRFHVIQMALQQVYAQAAVHGDQDKAAQLLGRWISWARRCRLVPLKKLAGTLRDRLPTVVRGMLQDRSNAYVETMNGQLQLAKRAARGNRASKNFIAIAYLRMSRLKHLPQNPLLPVAR